MATNSFFSVNFFSMNDFLETNTVAPEGVLEICSSKSNKRSQDGLLDKVFHPHRVCQRFSNQDESKKNKILSMAGPEVFFVETASG